MIPIISEPSEVKQPLEASVTRNVLTSVAGLPLMLLLMTVLTIPLIAFGIMDITTAVAVAVVSEISVLILALVLTDKTRKWKDTLYLKNFRFKNVITGFFVGLSLFAILQAIAIVIAMSGEKLESSETSTALAEIPGFAKIAVLLIVVPILVPIVEELFFRGFIFGFILNSGMQSKKRALIIGTLVSSVTFGIAHIQGFSTLTDAFVILMTAGIGAVNCWLIYKTDSIYAAIACHVGYNLANSAMSLMAS